MPTNSTTSSVSVDQSSVAAKVAKTSKKRSKFAKSVHQARFSASCTTLNGQHATDRPLRPIRNRLDHLNLSDGQLDATFTQQSGLLLNGSMGSVNGLSGIGGENHVQHTRHLIEALRQIKSGKQRPNIKRLIWMMNRYWGYNIRQILRILEDNTKSMNVLKAYVKGEYTFVDPETESRQSLVAGAKKDFTNPLVNALKENPRGATRDYIIKYTKIRYKIKPGNMGEEWIDQKLNQCCDELINAKRVVYNAKLNFISLKHDHPLNQSGSSASCQVNEVSLVKILLKSEVLPITPAEMFCMTCKKEVDIQNYSTYVSCKSCGNSFHTEHVPQSVVENYDELHWECNRCRSCLICRERDNSFEFFTCTLCERVFHPICLQFYQLDELSEESGECIVCKNVKIFGNYGKLRSGLDNLNLKMDFKNENEQLRELIKSSSRNEIRKQLFARVRTNDKSTIKNVKQVLNYRMLENAGKVLNIEQAHLKMFANAYPSYLKYSASESLVAADNRTYPFRINFGKYLLTPSCSSPYPGCETISNILYVCPHCFSYFSSSRIFLIHSNICKIKEPPGRTVYREDDIMIYEVNGETQKEYCTQLCLFSRAFLDHKTAYNSSNTFLFYIVVRTAVKLQEQNGKDTNKQHLKAKTEYETIGYFSKESEQTGQSFNLSCIVVWPPYLRQGFGFFMIDFSYLISRFERRTGSPEKPFSALGAATYFAYWRQKILAHVHKAKHSDDFSLSIADICSKTSIAPDDLLQTLEMYNYLTFDKESDSLQFNITQNELVKIKDLKTAKKDFFLNHNCTLHDNLSNFSELNAK